MNISQQETTHNRRIKEAIAKYNARDFHGALVLLNAGIEGGQRSAEMFWLRGIVHETLKDHAKAFEDLARCSSLAGARKRFVQKDICRVIKKLIKEGADDSWTSMIASYCQYMDGDIDKAIQEAQKIKSRWIRDYLAGLYCQMAGRREDATSHLGSVMENSDITDTEVRSRVMHILIGEGRGNGAAKTKEN